MKLLEMRTKALKLLKGSIWHTTSPERFARILTDELIRTTPKIADAERWKTSRGPNYFPFVRKIGGISLFDFREFDELEYSSRCPMSSWHEFIPVCSSWESAVWIEIDIHVLGSNFVDGTSLLQRWKDESAYSHSIMPYIEACSLVDIPSSAFIQHFTLTRPWS